MIALFGFRGLALMVVAFLLLPETRGRPLPVWSQPASDSRFRVGSRKSAG